MKNNMIILSTILFSLFAVMITFEDTTPGVVDLEFKKYVEEFELQAKKYNINIDRIKYLDIRFKSEEDTENFKVEKGYEVVGLCKIGWGERKIVIYQNSWTSFDGFDREQVLFHELGHCLLNRNHDDSDITINYMIIKKSLMTKITIDTYIYTKYRDYYIKELFEGE